MFGSILREEGLLAVLDDGTTGHNADKGILVVHDRDEILGGGPVNEVVHGGCDADGKSRIFGAARPDAYP